MLEYEYFSQVVKMGNFSIFATHFENSDGYCGTVVKNRQILETRTATGSAHYRRALSCVSVSRGVWRCLFYLKWGWDALFLSSAEGKDVKDVGGIMADTAIIIMK